VIYYIINHIYGFSLRGKLRSFHHSSRKASGGRRGGPPPGRATTSEGKAKACAASGVSVRVGEERDGGKIGSRIC
jgi:hypothetical protein